MAVFPLKILTPDGVAFDGSVSAVSCRTINGQIQLLAKHIDYCTALGMGEAHITLEDGTIAGSATCLAECFRRAVSFGVPLDAALRAATINPAQAVGLFDELGSITAGKRADILVLDETLHPEKIFIGGVQTK